MNGLGRVGAQQPDAPLGAPDDAAAPAPTQAATPRPAPISGLPARRPVIIATPPPDAPAPVADATAAAPTAPVAPAATPTVRSMDDVKAMVGELVSQSFPELKGVNFDYQTFQSDAYYFESNVKPLSVLFGPMKYVVEVNPKVFDMGVPRDAAKAILAHELSHTAYYQTHGRAGLLETGIAQLATPLAIPLERRTDLEAISRGYGPGLAQYRTWIYQHIPAADVAEKKKVYFTPDEITAIMAGAKEFPDLMDAWKKSPPRDLASIQRDVAARRARG